jgi:hypothetical protein
MTGVRAVTDGEQQAIPTPSWRIFPAMPTTRDLLNAAAEYVMDRDTLGRQPAKARVHAMPLAELVNLPPCRVMLYEAARSVA